MKKKLLSLLLALLLTLSLFPTAAFAARDLSLETSLAKDLKALHLFLGVSDTDFALQKAPTRRQALVMLIRLLGKEAEAKSGSWSHPFTDVDAADAYVGYAYEHGLTKGKSETSFGTGTVAAKDYVTFVLRALGYSDENGADFTRATSLELAKQLGILPAQVDTSKFLRADVVLVSYAALPVYEKSGYQRLWQRLVDQGVFTRGSFEANYDANALTGAVLHPASGEKIIKNLNSAWAPFEIVTKGSGNYYVVLEPADGNAGNRISFFVKGGDTVRVDVPLGKYKLYYATGADWYGKTRLFGAATKYYQAETTLDFHRQGLNYTGYRVELYLQAGGNLGTKSVGRGSFPA